MANAYNACNSDTLSQAFGRALSPAELDHFTQILENEADKWVRDGLADSFEDAMKKATPEAINELQLSVGKIKRKKAMDTVTLVSQTNYFKSVWADDPAAGLESLAVGSPFLRKGAKQSAALEQSVASSRNLGRLESDLNLIDPDRSIRKRYSRGELDDDMERAIEAIDFDKPDMLKKLDPDAIKMARVIKKNLELARIHTNRAGGNIGRLLGRLTKQTHDTSKLLHARRSLKAQNITKYEGLNDKDAWTAYMLDNLDLRQTFGALASIPDKMKRILDESYESLHRGDFLRSHVSSEETMGHTDVAFGLEQEREFFFKGVEERIQYRKTFGKGTVSEHVIEELTLKGHKEGLLKVFGNDALGNFRALAQVAQKMARKKGGKAEKKFNKMSGNGHFLNGLGADRYSLWYKEISGANAAPIENVVTTIGAGLRFSQNISKLGTAVMASVVDVATTASAFRYQGRGFFDSYADAIGVFFEGVSATGYKRDLADALNIGLEVANGYNTGRWSTNDGFVGTMSKANAFYFRMNLLTPWTDSMKRGVTISNARWLGTQATKKWGSLDGRMSELLNTYGIDELDWEAVQKIDFSGSPDGRAYVTMEGLKSVPEEVFTKQGRSVDDLEMKLRRFFDDQADSAIPTPDARVRARTTMGHEKGSVPREFWQSFFQFKAFPMSIHSRAIKRELYGRSGNPLGAEEISSMVEMMVASTVMGYAAMSLKDIVKGHTPRRPETPDQFARTFMRATLQGGAAGIWGDILVGDAMRRDPLSRGVIETMGGPVFGMAQEVSSILSGIGYNTFTDTETNVANKILKFAESNTPGANHFAVKSAINHLFLLELKESVAPGSTKRLKDRLEKEGQDFLLTP
jgi:hypothetical protein